MSSPIDDLCPLSPAYGDHAPAPPTQALRGDRRADVAIVGAGYTGLSTALHLAERGIRATVAEAKEIGWGASGRNFGQVVPYLKHGPAEVLAHFGREAGERLIEETGKGPDLVFGLIDKYAIDCALRRTGLIFAAHSDAGRAAIERRTEFWQARGAPVDMVTGADAHALIGSDYYDACALERRGGTINPLAYARGLAKAAIALGVEICTGSPVTSLARAGKEWHVTTPGGSVTADAVVLATNAYMTDRLWPGLRDSIIPVRLYQAVSRPLGENVRRTVLPQGQPLTDTRRLVSGVRLYADGRMHVSADGPAFDNSGDADLSKVARRLERIFPRVGPLDWVHRWAGWIAMTTDQYPRLHELAPGLWTGFGYSGRGIAHATMMGRDIAARVAGAVDATKLVFPMTQPRPSLVTRVAPPLIRSLVVYYRMRDAFDDARHRRARARS